MFLKEYNIFQSLYPNIVKSDFENLYGKAITIDDFCSKVGAYMAARVMFPNEPDPIAKLYSARQQERQINSRNAPETISTGKTGCCGGGEVK